MGTAHRQGELWSAAPRAWADVQEPQHRRLWEAMLDAADVGVGARVLDAGCGAGGAGGAGVLAAVRGAHVSDVEAVFQALRSAMPEPPSGGGPFALSAPGTLESLMSDAGLTIVGTGETDCPFTYPDVDSFWAGKVAAGPVQHMLRVAPESRLWAAVLDAIRPFVDDNGQIAIGPNVFRWVAATS